MSPTTLALRAYNDAAGEVRVTILTIEPAYAAKLLDVMAALRELRQRVPSALSVDITEQPMTWYGDDATCPTLSDTSLIDILYEQGDDSEPIVLPDDDIEGESISLEAEYVRVFDDAVELIGEDDTLSYGATIITSAYIRRPLLERIARGESVTPLVWSDASLDAETPEDAAPAPPTAPPTSPTQEMHG